MQIPGVQITDVEVRQYPFGEAAAHLVGYVQNVTAEIKASQTDTTGTELGWFAVFTPETDTDRPVLLLTMVEDVKERGGSSYVVERSSRVLDAWFREP